MDLICCQGLTEYRLKLQSPDTEVCNYKECHQSVQSKVQILGHELTITRIKNASVVNVLISWNPESTCNACVSDQHFKWEVWDSKQKNF